MESAAREIFGPHGASQAMIVRRNVIFQSTAFNTSQPKDYFINDCCYGDDVARWLMERGAV